MKISIKIILNSFFLFSAYYCQAQMILPLYPGPIPNSKPSVDVETSTVTKDSILIISKISRPVVTVYFPPANIATKTAIVICPGGGYWVEAAGHEGADVARALNRMGIIAVLLKYRIPNDLTMVNKEIGPVQDGQRAIQLTREHAGDWKIDPKKVGIMGFSAGGHLASTVGTHFLTSYIENPDHISLRPDFMILVYPVISLTDSIGHVGSRDQLLGKNPSPEKIREYSNEFNVTDQTPPSFLVQAKNDDVKVQNSIYFADSLKSHHVPFQIYLYEKGGHGYGMYNKTSPVKWMDLMNEWLRKNNFL